MKNPGVLGINARNLLYIKPYNPKKAIKMADNKIKTKHFLSARDVPVPRLFGVISDKEEVDRFDFNVLPNQFVLKPNLGFGGEGIIPVIDRDKETGDWLTVSGGRITPDEYKSHIYDILDGRFSVSGIGDSAFFEQLIIGDERIGKFSYKGLPDIRIIVYNLIPVMAMLRLPSRESDGKANLHLGALGAGIDLAKGTVTHIIRGNKVIDDEFGDDEGSLKNLKIPYWDEMLYVASKIQLITNLGYLAVDLAIDKTMGPVLLEMNARAGLNVQIANLAPLRRRLEQVEGIKVTSPEKGVRVAKDVFGNIVRKEIEHKAGKPVIGRFEEIEFLGATNIHNIRAQVDLHRKETVIDADLAKNMELITEEQYINEEKISVKIKFQLKGKKISTVAKVMDLTKKENKFLIGTRDLSSFLIDPSISDEESKGLPNPLEVIARTKIQDKISKLHESLGTVNYGEIDESLSDIEKQIKLLHHLKPINLAEELDKCREDFDYNPQFYYPELKFNPFELKKQLHAVKLEGNEPVDILFKEKRNEIMKKILLLEHTATESFTDFSIQLYGKPTQDLVELVKDELSKRPEQFIHEEETIGAEDAAAVFEGVFKDYDLKGWKVKIADSLVADCLAGKKSILFVRRGAKFSATRMESLVAHEIETHIISAENGKKQPYKILNRGTAGYLDTQEGLAVYNQNRVLSPKMEKWYWAMSYAIAVSTALKGSFVDVVKSVMDYGFSRERALKVAVKVKRGLEDTSQKGAFTKDLVYYKGYLEIQEFLKNGGDIKDLYYGKINVKDVDLIKKLPGIKEPKILPRWIKEGTS